MAEDINKGTVVGRLVRDAELTYTSSGTAICKFSIAVNRRVKQGENWVDEASFFDCTLWGKRGESLSPYLQKGTQVAVEFSLKQERWEQDGNKRSKVSLEVANLQLLGGNQQQGHGYQQLGNQGGGYQQPNNNYQQQNQASGYQPPPQGTAPVF